MNRRRLSKIFILGLSFGTVLLAYTNCGKQFVTPEALITEASVLSSTSNTQSTGLCDQDLKILFDNGYHKFLQTNCALCHIAGPGKGRFSSPNLDDAYADFMQTGYAKVSDNATSNNHNPPYSGIQHVTAINQLRVEWQQGLTDYARCQGTAVAAPTVQLKDILTLETSPKLVPTINLGQTTLLQWNLTTDLTRIKGTDPLPNIPGAQFSVMVGKYQTAAGATYYTFSQPRLFGSTVDVHIKTIQVKINGTLLTYPTTFLYVDTGLTGVYKNSLQNQASSLITTGSLVAPGALSSTDKVSFAFELIEPTALPAPKPPITVQFAGTTMKWVTPSMGFYDATINLATTADLPITITVSADNSNLCGSTNASVDISTCNPALSTFICASPGCPQTRTLAIARSVVGISYNRFDWDYKFATSSLTFQPGEVSKTIRIYFSSDIRRENNRLLTLKIDDNLIGATKGVQGKLYFVFNKLANPVPDPTVPTFSELMNPSSGILGVNCVKCHNSTEANKYNMTDYASMIATKVLIPYNTESLMYARMNPSSPLFSSSNPMPRDGQLDVDLRKQVEKWILNGAPNN